MITQATIYDLKRERDRLAKTAYTPTQKQREAVSRVLKEFKDSDSPLYAAALEERKKQDVGKSGGELGALEFLIAKYSEAASEEPVAIKPVIEVVLEQPEEQPVVIAEPKRQTPREKAITKRTQLRDAVRDILGNNPTPMRTKDIVFALRGKDIEFGESTLSALLNRSTIMFTSPQHGYWELVEYKD